MFALVAKHYPDYLKEMQDDNQTRRGMISARVAAQRGHWSRSEPLPTLEQFNVPHTYRLLQLMGRIVSGEEVFSPLSLRNAVAQAEARIQPSEPPAAAAGVGGGAADAAALAAFAAAAAGAAAGAAGAGAGAAGAAAGGDGNRSGDESSDSDSDEEGEDAQGGGQGGGRASAGGSAENNQAGPRLRNVAPIFPRLVEAMQSGLNNEEYGTLEICCRFIVGIAGKIKITNVTRATEDGVPQDLLDIIHNFNQNTALLENPFLRPD